MRNQAVQTPQRDLLTSFGGGHSFFSVLHCQPESKAPRILSLGTASPTSHASSLRPWISYPAWGCMLFRKAKEQAKRGVLQVKL